MKKTFQDEIALKDAEIAKLREDLRNFPNQEKKD